jgi:cytochrome c oxidase subunit 4
MSADSHAHAGGHGGDHVPHVLPLRTYFATWAALIVLTVITVGASYVDFGVGNLIVAMLIATIKACTVAALFMHLAFDHKFHSLIIGSSLIFLGIFISFTMFDTEQRGRADRIGGDRPADISKPFAGTVAQAELKAKWTKPAPEAAGAEHGKEPAAEHGKAAPAEPAHH